MKVLCVLIALMVAANAQEEQKSELAECGSRFADKIQALCGNFLNKDELVDLLNKSFEMYYKKGMTIKEINDYYIANYRNVGLDPDQVSTITDVYTKVTEILGGADKIKEYHKQAQAIALEFIKEDQKQVDQTIKELKAQGTSDANVELKVCQQAFALATAQKKIQLENKMFALIPADKLDQVKAEVRKVAKFLTDSQTS